MKKKKKLSLCGFMSHRKDVIIEFKLRACLKYVIKIFRYNKEEKWKCEAFHIIQKIVTIEKQKK